MMNQRVKKLHLAINLHAIDSIDIASYLQEICRKFRKVINTPFISHPCLYETCQCCSADTAKYFFVLTLKRDIIRMIQDFVIKTQKLI